MKFITWLISIPIVVLCVLFAVSNRQDVSIDLWPTGYVLNAPLFLVSLGGLLLGFLLGAVLFWARALPARLQRYHLLKEVEKLREELHAERMKHPALPPYGGNTGN